MLPRPRSRPSLLLLLLCAGLGWLISEELGSERWRARSEIPPAAGAPKVELPAPLPTFALPAVARLTETIDRPLFLPARRPVEVEKPLPSAETPKADAPLEVVVSGVIMAEKRQFALVRRQAGGETLRLAAGDTIDGWTVTSVLPDRVLFLKDETTKEIELKDLTPSKPKPKRERGRSRRRTTPSQPAPASGANPRPGSGTRQR